MKRSSVWVDILIIIIIGIVVLIFLILYYFHIFNPLYLSIKKFNSTTSNKIQNIGNSVSCNLISPGYILEQHYGSELSSYKCNIYNNICYQCTINVSNKIQTVYINCSNSKIENNC